MPEGHTLRKLADDLTAAFAGRRVRVSSPQGRFAADAEQLDRSRVIDADSAGKHLFLELEGERFVHVHLGLIGQFDVHTGIEDGAAGVPEPVGAVRLRLVTLDDTADPRPTAYAMSSPSSPSSPSVPTSRSRTWPTGSGTSLTSRCTSNFP